MTELSLSRRLLIKTKRELFSIPALGRFGLLYLFVGAISYLTIFANLRQANEESIVHAALWTLVITLACKLNYLLAVLGDEISGKAARTIFYISRVFIAIAGWLGLGFAICHLLPNTGSDSGRIAVALTFILGGAIWEKIFRPPQGQTIRAIDSANSRRVESANATKTSTFDQA